MFILNQAFVVQMAYIKTYKSCLVMLQNICFSFVCGRVNRTLRRNSILFKERRESCLLESCLVSETVFIWLCVWTGPSLTKIINK